MSIDKTDTTLQPVSDRPDKYFALLPTRECAFEIWHRIENYYNEMRRTGRLSLYRNAYMNYYLGWFYRASNYRSGEQGELTKSFWNHFRNILRHLKVQTTQNKITYKAQVLNSNYRSSQIVDFANGLADHYSQAGDYDLDSKGRQSVEDTLVFGESSIVGLWNNQKGDPVIQDPTTGQMLHDGDMDYFNVTPLDHIVNTAHQDRGLVKYRIIRRWVNKYDLATMYPEKSKDVVLLQDSESTYATKLVSLLNHDNETIPIFYFFHDKTPAVPMGRMLVMADPTCIFEDGPLDKGDGKRGYDHIPVYDNIVENIIGSTYGYTVGFDLLPLQQTLNDLVSAVITNNVNFATQIITAAKGANLEYQSLASGMSFVEWDSKGGQIGKPEGLNLTHSAPETYQLIDKIIMAMETLAGINSMMRGNPNQDVTSGQYAALVTVQSVIFNSGLQKAYSRLMESLMTGTIRTIKKNMIGKKIARIVGSTEEPYLKEFTSADLQDIHSISVELVNPMLQTSAGKMSLAADLMKTGLIKDPQQYIGVYTDGDLPQLYRRNETQLKLVKQENEAISKGQVPEVAVTDNHVMHILEHTPTIDIIEARLNPDNPQFMAAMAHIQKHLNKLAGGKDPLTGKDEGQINPILAGIIGDPTVPIGTPSAIQLPPVQSGTVPPPPTTQTNLNQQQGTAGTPAQPAQTLPNTGIPGQQMAAQ